MLHQEFPDPLWIVVGMVPQGPSNSLLDEEVGMLAVLQDVTGPSQSKGMVEPR